MNIICGDVNGPDVITICPSFMGSSSELINSLQMLNAIKSTLAFTRIQMDGIQKIKCNSKASLCHQFSWNGQKSKSLRL